MNDTAQNTDNQDHPDSWKLKLIRERLDDLRGLWQLKDDAAVTYKEAVEHAAIKANMDKGALATYINAVMKDKEKEYAERAGQLAMMFEEL
jgi:hypothetical protein